MPEENTDEVHDLRDIDVSTVGLVGKAANKRRYLLFKSQGDSKMPNDNDTAPTQEAVTEGIEKAGTLAEVKEFFKGILPSLFAKADAEENTDTTPAPVEPVTKEAPAPTETPEIAPVTDTGIAKATMEQVEALVKARTSVLEAALEKATADAAEATRIAKAERDLRIEQEYLEKAQTFNGLPVSDTELAAMLRKADAGKFGEDLEKLLKAAGQTIVMSGTFQERGTSQVSKSDGDPFNDLVVEKTAALQKSDPTKSEADAMVEAYELVGADRPDLAQAHVERKRRQAGGR